MSWWWGQSHLPETRSVLLATWMVRAIALLIALGIGLNLTRVVRTTPPPALLSTADPLYGIDDTRRHLIFSDLAADEAHARAESAQKFPGEPWSIEDERAAHERDRTREIAGNRKISVSQAYLILDEGIREHWPAPKHALDGSVVPLKPRFR
ncbi:MAG: hypothetical protein ABI461_03535 [Polyangiaceae bacterium]